MYPNFDNVPQKAIALGGTYNKREGGTFLVLDHDSILFLYLFDPEAFKNTIKSFGIFCPV